MAKRKMKNLARETSKLIEERRIAVEAAIDLGETTRQGICKATGLRLTELSSLFQAERDLYHKFCIIRKTIVDMASDNLMEVVADKDHPKNVEVSKWVLNNYKSDLDASLESKDSEDIEVEVGDGSKGKRPTVIRFKKNKKEE